ncbi:MAG: SLC13 family permease [Salinivirgaceae bacterium]|jgi:di/tricarboxylate transporter|nr:SLC13 family permease [Salinivirgaceae bacterium]
MIIFHQILVYIVILFIFISLYWDLIRPGFTFMLGITVLGIFRVLTPSEILAGLANEQIMVILLLLLLGDTFRQTSILDILFDRIFKNTRTYKSFIFKMFTIISPLSAFLNNTPLVALMMPYTHTWSKRHKTSVSKLLIPLSYAAILGGCMTLIGTSTNLIVSGLVADQKIVQNLAPLNMFDFFWVGFPMLIIGFLYVFVFGNKLLPSNTDVIESFVTHQREYIVETIIKEGSPLHGKTIKEANLRNLQGLYLFRIYRNDNYLMAEPSETALKENDMLLFTGDPKAITQLLKKNPSIEIPSVGMFAKKNQTEIVEIVVSHNSMLCNKTLKAENFRAKYDATAIAIHRNGERIGGKIGTLQLKAGDTILLLTGADFSKLIAQTKDFYTISKPQEVKRLGKVRTGLLVGGSLLVILLAALKVTSLFMGLMVLFSVLIIAGITTPKKLGKGVDFQLGIIIAMALALGFAMMKTGVAESLAQIIIRVFQPFGSIGLLAGIYIITTLLAAFITNVAAVALLFPISLTLALDLNLPYLPFVLVVSFAAAANFMTPIGYQTNTMVYGPGGYKFRDYLKIGTPLTLIYMVVAITVLSVMFL